MKNKKAAMEMSVGTIVTIVLLMSVLVLGLFLIKGIFSSAGGAVDLTDQQLHSEIEKLFSEDQKVMIFPSSKFLELNYGEKGAIGIGIKNLGSSADEGNSFSYKVSAIENNCGLDSKRVLDWIQLGGSESDTEIPIGGLETYKVTFLVSEGTPLCLANFKVEVKKNGKIYKNERFEVEVSA